VSSVRSSDETRKAKMSETAASPGNKREREREKRERERKKRGPFERSD